MEINEAIEEICRIEADDTLHEYGGGHGNKGNDFARFWLINELLSPLQTNAKDYLFVLEYVQDIVRFDFAEQPTAITLYQLKKKEGGNWDLNSLAGLTQKSTRMKLDSPLAKLLKAALSFRKMITNAEFVSNTHYKVDLEAGGTAVSMDYVGLDELTKDRQSHIGETLVSAHGINKNDAPFARVGLRYAPIEVNDMRVHVIGVAHGFLKQLSANHAAQADSFVDALFAKLATASRNTSKCKNWEELIRKRGYSRKQFDEALKVLQLLPDQQQHRESLLLQIASSLNWHSREKMFVEVAITNLTRLKVHSGEIGYFEINSVSLVAICDQAVSEQWSEVMEFQAIEKFLENELPSEGGYQIKALAIYLMVESWANRM